MIRATILALTTATMLAATGASAQQVQIPGGPSVDFRSERQRDRDFERERMRRDGDYRRGDRDYTTGSTGRCREVTIRERDDYGRMTTRTREECR